MNQYLKIYAEKPEIGSIYLESDENGNVKTYVKHFFGLIKKEVHLPDYPMYAHILAAKIECEHCKKQYMVYDNRYNGYDAVTDNNWNDESKNYQVNFEKKDEHCTVRIDLEYADDIEDPDQFISIDVYSTPLSGKRTVLLSEETD